MSISAIVYNTRYEGRMKTPIRVVISTCSTPTKNKVVRETLLHFSVTYCSIVYYKQKFDINNVPAIDWLDFNDLIYARYQTDWTTCIPLDGPLLQNPGTFDEIGPPEIPERTGGISKSDSKVSTFEEDHRP